MNRVSIELESFHHVYNRGTDRRIIFNDTEDYKRFVLYLDVVNDTEIQCPAHMAIALRKESRPISTDKLVNLVAFCLMPNHFHLLIQERVSGGISKFMQRLGTAYTMYFNEKDERSGALFQGRFKSKLIDSESYLLRVVDYIHLNPRDLPGSLRAYEWSSYHYYCGKNKFGYLLQVNTLDEFTRLERGEKYHKWLKSQNNFDDIEHLLIDKA
ncbi:MAG: transposase [Candidatus Vogelbacteria bacterium]|nr:transposase [Candidatus Vogelbacteria bacterium]